MSVGRYRITQPTIAVFQEGGRHVAHIVPSGALITIIDGTAFDGNRLVEVTWDGRQVMMFAQDLRSRAETAAND
jgi:hypothetical protein